MPSRKSKSKLRTASDVIARLKWSFDDQFTSQNSIVGYDCRIHGPMEKCVDDFAGIDEGGDIPEHRIQYFRLKGTKNYDQLLFWDRLGRVDRLFGSGNQEDPVSPITVSNVSKAVATMKSIAEEKAIRAQEKAKRRARQQARKAAIAKFAEISATTTAPTVGIKTSIGVERHVWEDLKQFFVYDTKRMDWIGRQPSSECNSDTNPSNENIKFITWNVLFDLTHNEKGELVKGDDTLLVPEDETSLRWQELMDVLADEDADVIALQEVTPRFLEQIQNCQWVKDRYCLSACTEHIQGIDVYGNLLLWKHSSFKSCLGLHLCRDGNRNRVVTVSLFEPSGNVFNISNVHLPADQYDAGDTRDRSHSRQRELGAIVSKLQALEQIQRNKKLCPIPCLLGDFNIVPNEPVLLAPAFWFDAWSHPSNETGGTDGFTFDWTRNPRAEKTRRHGHSERGPRRIDRVFIGTQNAVIPTRSRLLGDTPKGFPPSDHFGVSISFGIQREIGSIESILYNPIEVGHNAWSTAGVPTTDSLLALVFESQEIESTKLYDPLSTLPFAHITLLNGFVDLSNIEAQKLAIQAIQDAVHQTLYSKDPSKRWTVPIDQKSLTVFEHRESASLVCAPKKDKGSWLNRLYQTLRASFILCDEQESRFADGWTPHLSLRKYSSTSDARAELDALISTGAWRDLNLTGFGVGVFRRDVTDGKFYNVATVPLVDRPEVRVDQTSAFLQDGGDAWSGSMKGASSVVLYELQRACQYITNSLWGGCLNSRVLPYGSHALGVSLPGVSDVDTVVLLEPSSGASSAILFNMSGSQFFQLVASRLTDLHKFSKIRIRVSSSGGGPALCILTVKLAPNLPSVDLLLARTDAMGVPLDIGSQHALDSIEDAKAILGSAQRQGLDSEAFQGALRIIKLWANRRRIYGSSSGYLGGGGWAILLAWVLESKSDWKDAVSRDDNMRAASQVAVYFFQNAFSFWSNTTIVALAGSTDFLTEEERNNMVVVTPKSEGHFGRSSTTSTTLQTWQELRRTAKFLSRGESSSISNHLETCLLPYVEDSSEVLALKVEITSATVKPAEVKARGATLALSLMVALERVLSADQIRPTSGAVRKHGSFWFCMGINVADKTTGQLLSDFVSTRNELLKQEASSNDVTSSLVRMSREEYHNIFSH